MRRLCLNCFIFVSTSLIALNSSYFPPIGIPAQYEPYLPPTCERDERKNFALSLIKPGDIGVEIGVQWGTFAYYILLNNKPEKLYLIDPWLCGKQEPPEIDALFGTQEERDNLAEAVIGLFSQYPHVEVIRDLSENVCNRFENEYFDYVYIDGEHSYEAVTRDLTNYFYKVKIGGWIIGDDYGWTGIAQAVHDFLEKHKGECTFLTESDSGTTGGQFAIQRIR